MSKVTPKGYVYEIHGAPYTSSKAHIVQCFKLCKNANSSLDFFLYCLLILHEHKSKLPPKEHSVNHFTGNKVC